MAERKVGDIAEYKKWLNSIPPDRRGQTGTITRVHDDGSLDIELSNGNVDVGVSPGELEAPFDGQRSRPGVADGSNQGVPPGETPIALREAAKQPRIQSAGAPLGGIAGGSTELPDGTGSKSEGDFVSGGRMPPLSVTNQPSAGTTPTTSDQRVTASSTTRTAGRSTAVLTPRPPSWSTDRPDIVRLLDEVRIWMRDVRPVVQAANELRRQQRGAGDNSGESFLDLEYFDKTIIAADLARDELAADRLTSNSTKLSVLDLDEAQGRIGQFAAWIAGAVGSAAIALAIERGFDAATGANAIQAKLMQIAEHLGQIFQRIHDIYQIIGLPLGLG